MTRYLFNPLPRGRELHMPRGRRCIREQIVSSADSRATVATAPDAAPLGSK